ncbi:MAG: trigger factor family protein, partial [Pseudomonadota bacterium]
MQISIETMTGLERRLTISVPSETFEAQISDRLGEAARQVRLPGFRPGKVPMREVRRRFGPAVRAEVAGELMQSSFVDAVQKEELAPAGSPSLEVVKMDPGMDFEFTATFEVFPAVELSDLSKATVKKPEAEITEADLEM